MINLKAVKELFFEKDKTAKKTQRQVYELENTEISSELAPLEEVMCDCTVSESDFAARICF